MKVPLFRPALAAAAALAIGGCSTYGNYGYGGASIGYGRSYSSPYFGWYDGYYYPGTGYYIYDRSGSRYRWNDYQRRYWEARRPSRGYRENWSGYRAERRDDRREYRQARREDRREYRRDRRENSRDYRRDRREDRRDRRRSRN